MQVQSSYNMVKGSRKLRVEMKEKKKCEDDYEVGMTIVPVNPQTHSNLPVKIHPLQIILWVVGGFGIIN